VANSRVAAPLAKVIRQLPEAVERFRANLPARAQPKLERLEANVMKNLDPKEAYNMVPGRDT